jgi:hypothetical protein
MDALKNIRIHGAFFGHNGSRCACTDDQNTTHGVHFVLYPWCSLSREQFKA